MSPKELSLDVDIERKDKSLPRFVVVPDGVVSPWALSGTTAVEVTINEVAVGRRNLKKWGGDRDCWFVDLTDRHCAQAGVDTGDRVRLLLRMPAEQMPSELKKLIKSDAAARAAWEHRSPSQQRMLCDHVFEAKQPGTRERRARKALLGNV